MTIVDSVSEVGALERAYDGRRVDYLVIDTRARARPLWEGAAHGVPLWAFDVGYLWVQFGDDAPSPDGARDYATDAALEWHEPLGALPVLTRAADPTLGARLRSRLALLPADVCSIDMFRAVTAACAHAPKPRHARPREGCAECRPPVPAGVIRRDNWVGRALLRLLLRPEWYCGGSTWEGGSPGRANAARSYRRSIDLAALDGGDRDELRVSRRKALDRALTRAGLIAAHDIAQVALVVRARALAAAYDLRPASVARLLGFSSVHEIGRTAYRTFARLVEHVTECPPSRTLKLEWPDLAESARLALVSRTGFLAKMPRPWPYRPMQVWHDDFDPGDGWPYELERYRPALRRASADQAAPRVRGVDAGALGPAVTTDQLLAMFQRDDAKCSGDERALHNGGAGAPAGGDVHRDEDPHVPSVADLLAMLSKPVEAAATGPARCDRCGAPTCAHDASGRGENARIPA